MIKKLCGIAIPSIVSLIIEEVFTLIDLIFAGHLNEPAKFAGVGLGNMCLIFGGLAFLYGLNMALETFVS